MELTGCAAIVEGWLLLNRAGWRALPINRLRRIAEPREGLKTLPYKCKIRMNLEPRIRLPAVSRLPPSALPLAPRRRLLPLQDFVRIAGQLLNLGIGSLP